MAKGNLTLKIRNITNPANWSESDGTTITDDGNADKGVKIDTVFEADNLTWSVINSIWSECSELYNGYCFKIVYTDNPSQEITCGNINAGYTSVFSGIIEKEPNNYSGFIYTDRGVSEAIVVESNASEDDIKTAILQNMIADLFGYIKFTVKVENTASSSTSTSINGNSSASNVLVPNAASATFNSNNNLKISLNYELQSKENVKAIDAFNIRPRQFGTPNPYDIN